MLNTVARQSEQQITLSGQEAGELVERWLAAWNGHDLEALLNCYRDDVDFRSPFVRRVDGADAGVLRGKASLCGYFASALERFPDLELEVQDVVLGPGGSVTVEYRGISDLVAIETMFLDQGSRVWRAEVQYRAGD